MLLVVVCVCVEPIANGIGCQTAGSSPAVYQPAGWQAPASAPIVAPQPAANLAQSVAPASEPTAPASCSYITGRTPLGAMAPLSFLDKIPASIGAALVSTLLVRRVRPGALLRLPQPRYPPPTPPPIALSCS